MSEHSFRFAFVSNSRAIAEAVREYAQGRGMGMEIRLASMEKALPVARELLENGVEVILGGGGTGRLLRGRLQRPVVTISNDHLSVLRSLMQARQYSSSIAVTCYERIPEWVGPFAELLHISILPILFTTSPHLETTNLLSDSMRCIFFRFHTQVISHSTCLLMSHLFFLSFFLFRATPAAYRGSQARG